MEASASPRLYHCPLCGEHRALADTCLGSRSFEAYHKACWGRKPDVANVELWNERWRDWACTICIQAGRAIVANYRLQTSLDAFPPAMVVYRDAVRKCADCRQDYVFTAQEQRLWYEEWRIPMEAEPRACTECRKKRRQGREVSIAVQALKDRAKTAQSLEAMQALVSFYKAHDKPTQADYWSRLARKVKAQRLEELAALLERLNVNDAAEVERIAALLAETGQADTPMGRDFARRIKGLERGKKGR
ncbi:MAG: zinc-ribbon domain containing protein [Bacteroidetes bacterium]|nr:zinc-ribbon domain containing protein [Bacteroidota bacterium]